MVEVVALELPMRKHSRRRCNLPDTITLTTAHHPPFWPTLSCSTCIPYSRSCSRSSTLKATIATPSNGSNRGNQRCNHTGRYRVQAVLQKVEGRKVGKTIIHKPKAGAQRCAIRTRHVIKTGMKAGKTI